MTRLVLPGVKNVRMYEPIKTCSQYGETKITTRENFGTKPKGLRRYLHGRGALARQTQPFKNDDGAGFRCR
jgi:hypothetical protein